MKKFDLKPWLVRLCVPVLAFALVACGDTPPEPKPDEDQVNQKITFSNGVPATAEWGGGNGAETTPWEIRTPGQLRKLVADVDNGEPFDGKYFKLMVDVEVTADEWTPIGTGFNESYFSGSFDGNGKTVSGHLQSENYYNFGFFGNVFEAGEIKNLTLTADVTNNYSGNYSRVMTGGIIGLFERSGTISGCTVTNATITGAKGESSNTGGIVGSCPLVSGNNSLVMIKNCKVSNITVVGGEATEYHSVTGGMVGVGAGISDCIMSDVIVIGGDETNFTNSHIYQSFSITGGLAGSGDEEISGCKLTRVSVTGGEAMADVNTSRSFTGGVVGYTVNSTVMCEVTDCTVTGNAGAQYSYVGGVVAYSKGSIKLNTVTGGIVTGGSGNYIRTGGIAGASHEALMEDCTVSATTKVMSGNNAYSCMAGGISGETGDTLFGCQMKGTIQAGTDLLYSPIGGLVGYLYTSGRIHTSIHSGTATGGTGEIIGVFYVGGLVGLKDSNSVIYDCSRNTGTPEQCLGSYLNHTLAVCTEGHTSYPVRVPLRSLVPSAEALALPVLDTLDLNRN